MNHLERLSLVDRVGRELQVRMSYTDIDVYLGGHGVDTNKPTSGVNSKWVYTKELLVGESDEVVVRIANELEIPHTYTEVPGEPVAEAIFWEQRHFRLFISHLSEHKKTVGRLQRALLQYGIAGFVAHVDIEPTREWQDEIEAGLASMDALAAVLTPGFQESNWTDQEVGYALGRGVLIVPVIHGLTPYGFIGKYQGLFAVGKSVAEVARAVFDILVNSSKTRARMLTCMVDAISRSVDEADALIRLARLSEVDELPVQYLERLRDSANSSAVLREGEALGTLNRMLETAGLARVSGDGFEGLEGDEDLPF